MQRPADKAVQWREAADTLLGCKTTLNKYATTRARI